ncbi:amidohydrolase family protein [Francisella philomiragia]|nr:amidohydrolase family protein [Francisella philomiragia]MBK2270237.1 amidohydrolase family protein [Francisella philomiragia]MBK2272064.1 amidohydrolase family protein [Francisella philomiragia]MBK2275902.1 amidohydrolase family protein [Francisella philomiragia]MBK2295423.1 amidohydrolase family protein [Francisella philomiragia]
MPGLIDAHVHLSSAASVDLANDNISSDFMAIESLQAAEESLLRGFTTLRDAGGAGYGIARAFEKRKATTPRLFYSGKALSATGGHGDFRETTESKICSCQVSGSNISTICDGVPEVLKATREQLREGATQIKIMAAGGIASPADKITNLQFSDDEILAIVDEAKRNGTYVMAHAYTPEALIRCVKLGVRSLEHANLLDEKAAKIIAANNAFIVPTLAIYEAFYLHGKEFNTPDHVLEKLGGVRSNSLEAIKIAHDYSVNVGFGTDLLGGLMKYQSTEFKIRSQVETPFQTLYSATYKNAELLNMTDMLGVIKSDAFADIIVLEGNPLEDIGLLVNPDESIKLIIKDGYIVLDKLTT